MFTIRPWPILFSAISSSGFGWATDERKRERLDQARGEIRFLLRHPFLHGANGPARSFRGEPRLRAIAPAFLERGAGAHRFLQRLPAMAIAAQGAGNLFQ